MKTVSYLALVTAICIVIFWVFMAIRPASACETSTPCETEGMLTLFLKGEGAPPIYIEKTTAQKCMAVSQAVQNGQQLTFTLGNSTGQIDKAFCFTIEEYCTKFLPLIRSTVVAQEGKDNICASPKG
jgi:hypothetical protein